MAVFSGDLRSDNFSAGLSGWRIDKVGNAEFNQLIVRDSIVDGAVSNGGNHASQVSPATKGNGAGLGALTLGAFSQGEFWQIAARLKYRMHSRVDTSYTSGKVGFIGQRDELYTQPRLQWRIKAAGVWGAWSVLEDFPIATTASWIEHDTVISKQGVYQDVQIRILINLITQNVAGQVSSVTYTNVHETSYVARALVR
jgi:hypothetical protein